MTSDTVDRLGGASSSLAFKAPCRCATTANITLSGMQTLDGILPTAGEHESLRRILVKNQTTAAENGIWIMVSSTWSRARDFDGTNDFREGTRVYVHDGASQTGGWIVTSSMDPGTFAVGSDTITFTAAADAELTFAALDALNYHGADIASAATVNLNSATGTVVDITGTTTITAITLSEGKRRLVRFTSSLILTHSSTLVLPGATNITTQAGDYAEFVGYASSVVRVAHYLSGPATSRERLAAARTYYVRTDGSDSNDGLANSAAGAFLTLQHAWNVIAAGVDLGGFTVTIQLVDGTYTAGVRDLGKPIVGGRVTILGNTGTPANVVIAEDSDDCIEMAQSDVTSSGMKLTNSGGSGVHAYRCGVINVSTGVQFGACSEAHMFCDNEGQIVVAASYTVNGNSPYHWLAHTGGFITIVSRTVTLSGTPAFSSAFAYALRGGIIEAQGNTYSGSATGARFIVDDNGTIYTGSTTVTELPGNAAGQLTSGVYGTNLPDVSSAKGWAIFSSSGSVTASHNVTSVTDNGTGSWSINWAVTFGSASYCSVLGVLETSTRIITAGTQTTAVLPILVFNSTFGAADATRMMAASFGSQT